MAELRLPKGARRVMQPQGYAFWVAGDERAVLRDAYHSFLHARWPVSIAWIAAVILAANVVFATAYTVGGGVENARPGNFWDAFVFSVQTLGTIGYGVMRPQSNVANIIMIVESITGVIVIALVTGLVFAKFARASARVAVTAHAVITKYEGAPTLQFRISNKRANAIVDARLRVAASLTTITAEGQTFYRVLDLPLVRDHLSSMRRGWTVIHRIDESSPLYGKDAAALARDELELEVSVIGFDDTTMQTVYSIHYYNDTQIKPGYRFVDMMSTLPNGDYLIDLTKFDAIVPDHTPRDSVAA